MTRRTPPIPYSQLPPFEEPIKIIEYNDRTKDGIYEILPDIIHVHPFIVESNKQQQVEIFHLNQNENRHQSFGLRVWVSTEINGIELFFRFHPDSGGISHVFHDKDILVPLDIKCKPPQRNMFSAISFQKCDIPIPLDIGNYYYHIQNLEKRPNAYKINFMKPLVCCPDGSII